MSWTNTPFNTIEEAHATALRMGLASSAIINTGGFSSFQLKEGRDTVVIAQASKGGPVKEKHVSRKAPKPPLQDPSAPTWGASDELRTGPWIPSDHETFDEVRQYYERNCTNVSDFKILEGILVRVGDTEYEYFKSPQGMLTRVLFH